MRLLKFLLKLDEEIDENWIMLVYLKDNDPTSNIIVEDKTNPTKISLMNINLMKFLNFQMLLLTLLLQ